LGAPVRLNGWRKSVTVQVSRPFDRVVVAHLAHVPLAGRAFRAEMPHRHHEPQQHLFGLVAQARDSLTVSCQGGARPSGAGCRVLLPVHPIQRPPYAYLLGCGTSQSTLGLAPT
jgi:hypothetical protein